ncbi:MAG: FeoB-associated Cys-rich membrane protein [Pirellulales bacterium]|nr:FeoB-associated Cys-rich membrane protein [Pirellulales bacterium]
MEFGGQDIAVFLIIAAAAAYVMRRVFRTGPRDKPAGCDQCSGCSGSQNEKELISIALPRPRDEQPPGHKSED